MWIVCPQQTKERTMELKRNLGNGDFVFFLHTKQGLKDISHKVLEIGFGEGHYIAHFLTLGYEVHAVDKSKKTCNKLLLLLEENDIPSTNLEIHHTDARNFEYGDDMYSLVICQNLLHFLPKDHALNLLNNLIRSIKQNGYLLLTVHHEDHPSKSAEYSIFKSFYNESELEEFFNGLVTIIQRTKHWKPLPDDAHSISYFVQKL